MYLWWSLHTLYLLARQVELLWAIQVFVVVSLVCRVLLWSFDSSGTAAGCLSWEVWWLRTMSTGLAILHRPRYRRESLCHDPAGNRTTRRPPDHHKETQTEVVWTCLPFIGSGQTHLARHSERGKTRQTKKRWEDNISEWTGPRVRQVREGGGEQRKLEETGRKVIPGASTTPAVKG